jgi:hypothetical protein
MLLSVSSAMCVTAPTANALALLMLPQAVAWMA